MNSAGYLIRAQIMNERRQGIKRMFLDEGIAVMSRNYSLHFLPVESRHSELIA